MKWLFYGAGIVLAAALLMTGCKIKKLSDSNTDDMDGGVVTRRDDADAPKFIESTEITDFNCTVSLLSEADPGELGHCVYKMKATVSGETVQCLLDWHGESSGKIEFETDKSFMEKLCGIITEHDLAKHNGFYHSVSGLPDVYGDIISVTYASGESIYAKDNQDGFLGKEAQYDLVMLFKEAAEAIPAS